MKKNYFLILLTILLGLGSYSQTAVIGTPGTSINQYVPIEPYYDYSYSQSIYTAAELTASGMTGVTQIDTLVFEYNGSTLIDIYDWVIYMGNSNKSTFSGVSDYISLLSLSKNFDGVPIISGTASPYLVKIPLSTPFIWDGVSNLVISADENTSGWESRDFFTRSVTGNRSVYYYQDGTNVDPASPAASNQGTGSYVPNLTLSYSTPPACIPANYYAHSAEVNGVNATIRWDGVTGTAWEYQYGAPGFTLAATGTAVSVDSVNISGLSPLTNYEVRLRSVCGASSSPWSGPIYFTSGCAAPMAGNYTINPAFPTAGTNYNSFADALSQMALCGVGAPVKFNVAAGTYTGEILVETLLGASAANTVTFDGSAGVTLTNNNSSSSFATVRFKEASYVTFQNFTMTNTGYGRIVFFDENNDHITIKKCTFNCQVGTSSAFTAIYNESGYSSQPRMSEFITIDSNVINDGYQGVYMYGAGTTSTLLEEGNVVTNNTINRCHYYGVYMYRQQNTVVSNNTMVQKSVSPNTAGYGMYFRYCDLSVKINANKITLNNTTGTSYGLYIDNCDGNSSNSIDVTNNMIVTSPNGTSATQRGLYSYDSKYVNIYHNSVNLLKGSATSSSTAAFYTNASSTYKHNIQNNIFVNSNGGYAAYFSSSTFAGVDSITNNIFYCCNNICLIFSSIFNG